VIVIWLSKERSPCWLIFSYYLARMLATTLHTSLALQKNLRSLQITSWTVACPLLLHGKPHLYITSAHIVWFPMNLETESFHQTPSPLPRQNECNSLAKSGKHNWGLTQPHTNLRSFWSCASLDVFKRRIPSPVHDIIYWNERLACDCLVYILLYKFNE